MYQKPQISESEHWELVLDSYVMHIHWHNCANCGAHERFSQLYEVWVHPTKTRTTGFSELRPISWAPKPNLPFATVAIKPRDIALCAACAVPQQATTTQLPVSRTEWGETLKRKYAVPASEPKVATRTTPQRAVPTLDQL